MPLSQVELPMDPKSGRSLNSKYSPYDTMCVSSSTVRPLGVVRNHHESPVEEDAEDSYSLDFNSDSGSCRDSDEENDNVKENPFPTETFLQNDSNNIPDLRERQLQVFKARLSIAASRKNHAPSKMEPLASKKLIQLPMLKLNLESITGAKHNDDSKTLENTRRSLKTLIDDGKRSVKRSQFIVTADKSKDQSFSSQVDNISPTVQTSTKRRHSHGKQSPLCLPPAVQDGGLTATSSVRKTSSFVNKDAIASVALSNAVLVLDTESVKNKDVTYHDDDAYFTSSSYGPGDTDDTELMIDLVNRPKSSTKPAPVTLYDMATWPSYEEVRNLRRDNGSHGCSKHEYLLKRHKFQQELLEQRNRAKKDQTRTWVNINSNSGYKASPIIRYTTYQGNKLEPISSPTHDHCPVCNMYKGNKVSTACPPNSPKETRNETPFPTGPLNEDDLKVSSLEGADSAFGPDGATMVAHFQDINKLEPVSASRLAKKRGFRGSKTPIAFKLGYDSRYKQGD